jgi:hypothetical protein
MKVSKSAKIKFNDDAFQVIFDSGAGKSSYRKILTYSEETYPLAKQDFEEFLAEPDLREKITKFAHAINLGSKDDYSSQLVFMFEVMWRYDWSKTIPVKNNPKEGEKTE